MNDSYLFDLGWLFFGAWTLVVGVVSVMAFAPELFPARSGKNTSIRASGQEPLDSA